MNNQTQHVLVSAKLIPQNNTNNQGGNGHQVKGAGADPLAPITKEAMEKHRRNVFERLTKRTLRGKVIKLIDENIHFRCNKLLEHQKKQNNLHENGIYYKTIHYLEKRKEPDFKKRKMIFTTPESNDFFPKTKLISKVDEIDRLCVGDRFDQQFADEDKETMEAFSKICKKLTKEDLLEIGEDPNYFIVKPSHRQRKQLLRAKLWDDVAGLKDLLDNDEEDELEEKRKQKAKAQEERERNQGKSGHFEKDRFMKPLSKTQKMDDPDEIDPLEKKQALLREYQRYLVEQHRERQGRFEKRAVVEEALQIDKKHELESKYVEKIRRADKTISEIKEAITRKKYESQQKEDEQLRLIHKNRMKQREDDEIFLMNTQLRRILIEHQIEVNKNHDIQNKLAKIKSLERFQPTITRD